MSLKKFDTENTAINTHMESLLSQMKSQMMWPCVIDHHIFFLFLFGQSSLAMSFGISIVEILFGML